MMFVVMRSVVAAGSAYLLTLALERLFDIGVIAALFIGVAALFMRTPLLVVAMPLLGLTHADPEWLRTTVVLYVGYAAIVFATIARRRIHRKSTSPAER